MLTATTPNHRVNTLKQAYKQLIEEAYNYSQLDPALSNISEYKAFKILNELNQLRVLN